LVGKFGNLQNAEIEGYVRWVLAMPSLSKLLPAIVASAHAGIVIAQPRENLPVELPDGPAKPGFDIERFSNAGNGWFETFYVEKMEPLRQALDAGRLTTGTRMLVMETAGGNLALVTDQMAYHHLAQGTVEGTHWLATF
jgi:hypothetical protein